MASSKATSSPARQYKCQTPPRQPPLHRVPFGSGDDFLDDTAVAINLRQPLLSPLKVICKFFVLQA